MIHTAPDQADGLLLPPLLAHRAPSARARLPEHVRMNSVTRCDGDFNKYRETIKELKASGYALFGGPAISIDSEPTESEDALRKFSTPVLERLR
jgi:hypothetical protein